MDVSMFFAGSVLYGVDKKGRINIPAQFRMQLDASKALGGNCQLYYVTVGLEKCLNVFPEHTFEAMVSKMEEETGATLDPNENMPKFVKIMGSAQTCRADQQGRIIVPKKQLEEVKIESQVRIVGLGRRIQFWNPDLYEAYIP